MAFKGDRKHLHKLCTSVWTASSDLCHSLVLVVRCISTSFIDADALQPLLNCQLIENPGVRPSETSRRIIAKAVLYVVKLEIMDAAGCLQLCAEECASCEATKRSPMTLKSHTPSKNLTRNPCKS